MRIKLQQSVKEDILTQDYLSPGSNAITQILLERFNETGTGWFWQF